MSNAIEKAPDDEAVAVDPTEHQVAAEASFWKSVFVGALIGMVVCAGIWVIIVLLALSLTDADPEGFIWIGVITGLFAGTFLGGAMGAGAGVRHLEHAEHTARRPAP
jgi:hypothetical protein